MLTEIAVVLALDFSGIALALVLTRWTLARAAGGVEARRLVSAAARASEAFLLREGRLAAVGLGLSLLLVFGMNGVFVARKVAGFTTATMTWTALATVLGAVLTLGVGYLSASVGLRATQRTIRAAQVSLDQTTMLGIRASGVTALSADALGTAAVTGIFGLVYLLGGGGAAIGADAAAALLGRAAAPLPGFCLGSVATALVLGVGGATYHVSANIGGLGAHSLEANDPRNPALVALLVGEHVGLGARRAADMFAAASLGNVAMILIGVAAFRDHAAALGGHAWALVTLPLLVRGIGVVASGMGLVTARATESGRAVDALFRGQVTATVLVAGGLAGSALWLLGSPVFGWFVAAGSVGAALAVVVGHVARLQVDRRLGPVQEMLEVSRAGQAVTLARGLSLGARAVWLPAALLLTALAFAWHLGERSHLPGGGALAVATALSGLLATSAYMLVVGLVGPVATGALTIAALDPEDVRPDVRRRTLSLDDAGFEGGAIAESFFIVVGSVASLLAGLSIVLGRAAPQLGLSLDRLQVVGSGALGAVVVLSYSGSALAVAARSARGAVLEVERQLKGFAREGGALVLPAGYTPSYRAVIELTGKQSLEGVIVPVCLCLLGPVLLGMGLRLAYGAEDLARESLTCFVVVAALTGLASALSADGSRAVLGAAYRASRPRNASTGFEASLAGQRFGSFVGGAGAPSIHLFVKATAAAALLVAPFLSAL